MTNYNDITVPSKTRKGGKKHLMKLQAKRVLREERDRLLREEEHLFCKFKNLKSQLVEIRSTIDSIDRATNNKISEDNRRIPLMRLENLSVINVVREVLKRTDEPLNAEGVKNILQEWGLKSVKMTSIRTALMRLAEEPHVNRVKRGIYQFIKASFWAPTQNNRLVPNQPVSMDIWANDKHKAQT